MDFHSTDMSCGVCLAFELSGDAAWDALEMAINCFRGPALAAARPAFAVYLFSDAVEYYNGSELASFLATNKLGQVTTSPTVRNPNSDHDIIVWIFTPDVDAFRKWAKGQNENLRLYQSGWRPEDPNDEDDEDY